MVEQLYVAPAVWEEVFILGPGKPGAREMQESRFFEKHPVQNQKAVEMLKVFLGPAGRGRNACTDSGGDYIRVSFCWKPPSSTEVIENHK
ncbi:MAG: hypothetical protein A2156_00065 [Deltaproteobacteria bacterium RBG_16_48_10]|nr:MAG: hypothetical protein A2156_00065 [Deltaproteobacteria bacterium RBG_16_48_10]